MGLNNSKSEDSTSKMETNTSEPPANMNVIIIFVVCVLVIIIAIVNGIIRLAFNKRLSKKLGNFKVVKNFNLFFYFLRATSLLYLSNINY